MFGAKRQAEYRWGPCQPCTRFEPAPAANQDCLKWQIHEGIDLGGEPGECVFAAYAGTVVDVSITAGGAKGNITIDHHEIGFGLISRYLHIDGNSICVGTGTKVTKGQLLASLDPPSQQEIKQTPEIYPPPRLLRYLSGARRKPANLNSQTCPNHLQGL